MSNFVLHNTLGRPLVIAHRGASRIRHENTLEAFEAAIDVGADAIECDLRRTRDNVIVVHHNARVKRSYRRISHLDQTEVLRYASKQEYVVPTLEETLRWCRGRIALDIELKEPGYEREVIETVKRLGSLDATVFKSFHDEVVLAVKTAEPKATTGLLIGVVAPQSLSMRMRQPVSDRLDDCRADFVAPNWKLVTPAFMARAKEKGRPVLVWTVNRKALARRLVRLGVDGLIGNVPERLLDVVGPANTER